MLSLSNTYAIQLCRYSIYNRHINLLKFKTNLLNKVPLHSMPYLCKCNQLFYGQHIAILWLVIITECNARAQITENASSSSKGDDGSTNTKHWFKVFHLHWGSLHFQKKKKKDQRIQMFNEPAALPLLLISTRRLFFIALEGVGGVGVGCRLALGVRDPMWVVSLPNMVGSLPGTLEFGHQCPHCRTSPQSLVVPSDQEPSECSTAAGAKSRGRWQE